jgi:spermidine dehydrogenase
MSGHPTRRPPSNDPLGLTSRITRRDFVNGALVGSGAALMAGRGRAATTSFAPSGSPWTGYGGVGDYSWANGNTEAVINAAHGIRDRTYPAASGKAVDEEVDLVIVGGGFSGMTAAYEFTKRGGTGRTCLLLENHPVMGGEAKQNEFIVDGRRLTAPQGSNGALTLKTSFVKGSFDGDTYDVYTDYYRELGMPAQFDLEPLAGGAERYEIPNYHFGPMAPGSESGYETGYYFRGHGWVANPARDKFAKTPWPPAAQKDMDDFVHFRRTLPTMSGVDAWLDSITYYDLLDKLNYGPQVRQYIDPYMAVANFGVGGNAISGYAAKRLGLPGTNIPDLDAKPKSGRDGSGDIGVVSFPGGNATILRMMLARMIPGAIGGDGSIAATASAPINFARLDRAGAPLRIRLGATAIDVRHEGNPATAGHVLVTYVRNGKIRKVRAKSVVMASGGWVTRNIVSDLPETFAAAYREFHHGPVLTANVALRNWRFFDKLGFTAARWFEGLGWHVSVRRNVAFGITKPLTPDDPIVLTFYIAILNPDLPASEQGPASRMQIFSTSYTDYEQQIRTQMTEMFGVGGFDARRDIAGIVLNRWGHAFCAPQPGFFLGRNGQAPPPEVLRQPHGRIVFAHSELQGLMSMAHGMKEAYRGATQALAML